MTTNKFSHRSHFFKNENFFNAVSTLLVLLIMFLIISNPTRYSQGTISGLKLFFQSVLPGLFPFMLLTKLITELGFLFQITPKFDKLSRKLFGTPGVSFYAFFMSILSGYPIGAKIISDLYSKGLITEQEAQKMSVFCTTSGPIFVIGSVGSIMFNSLKIGIIIYASHIISSIVMGVFYNLLTRKNQPSSTIQIKLLKQNNANLLNDAINQTITSLFVVAAYITIFYLLTEVLESISVISLITNTLTKLTRPLGIHPSTIKGITYGFLEVTRGAKELSQSITPLSISLCCGIISFSGLSINLQMMSFLKTAKIKARNFFLSKCVHCVLSIFICYLIVILNWCHFNVVNSIFKFISVAFNNCKVLV